MHSPSDDFYLISVVAFFFASLWFYTVSTLSMFVDPEAKNAKAINHKHQHLFITNPANSDKLCVDCVCSNMLVPGAAHM